MGESMNGYEFAQQYYKRLADGESINTVNRETLLDGSPNLDNTPKPLLFWGQGIDYTWRSKTITVTIPEPMSDQPTNGSRYYHLAGDSFWCGVPSDLARLDNGLIWSTKEDRDEAMRILKGGKSEA